jgi:hypothetical protein
MILIIIIIIGLAQSVLRAGYGLEGPGSIPGKAGLFSSNSVQTGSRFHPAFYPMGTGGSFPGGKAQ